MTLHAQTHATLTPAWLTEVLKRSGHLIRASVSKIAAERIGAEVGFLDSVARWRLTYDVVEPTAPQSLVVKVSSTDDAYRRIGEFYDAYEREFRFYRTIAATAPIRLPTCFGTEIDPATGAHVLLLEDLAGIVPGDQVRGLTVEQARDTLLTIGRFQAAWWDRPELDSLDWMPRRNIQPARYHAAWPRFRETFAAKLPIEAMALGAYLDAHFDSNLAEMEQSPLTIAHSDFRADNLLFDPSSSTAPVVVLDWQLAIRGRGIMDVARLLCGSLAPHDRAANETSLVAVWHQELLRGGVVNYSLERAMEDYKRAALLCLYYPVTIHEAEEHAGPRGFELAQAQIERFFAAVVDLTSGGMR